MSDAAIPNRDASVDGTTVAGPDAATALARLLHVTLEICDAAGTPGLRRCGPVLAERVARLPRRARADLARRHACSAGIPPDVVRALADDGPGICEPMLRHSPRLSGDYLLAVATGPSLARARLIAGRRDLGPEVTHALFARGDPWIAAALRGAPPPISPAAVRSIR